MIRAARVALVTALLVLAGAPASAKEGGFEPILTGADFPTNLAFAPDGRAFFTEKDTGRVRVIADGELLEEPFAVLPSVTTASETGLLGIAIPPDFAEDPWVYVYYSDAEIGDNRVVRIRAEGDRSTDVEPVIDLLPWVNGYHNGGDLAFGTDGMLFVSVGEAHEPGRAQDPSDLGGKILRITPDGSVPEDNPTAGSPVYALGIRNSFGLCVNPTTGDLWETENGPDAFDEVNLIEPGGNFGWPDQLGPGGEPTYVDPVLAFEQVVVPTGCAVTEDGSTLYFGTYGGELHRLSLPPGDEPRDEVVASTGAVTDVARAPDGSIWVATSGAIYRMEDAGALGAPTPTATGIGATGLTGAGTGATGASGATGAGPSPNPAPADDRLSPVAIVIGLILIGGLLLFRSRIGRR